MSSKLTIVCLAVLALSWNNVQAVSDADKAKIVEMLLPAINDCSAEHPLKDGDIAAVVQSGQFTSLNSCLIGCVMKKIGMLDASGLMNPGKVAEVLINNLSDPADESKAQEVLKSCTSINDKAVSDADKGCERAKLLVDCFAPNRELFFP